MFLMPCSLKTSYRANPFCEKLIQFNKKKIKSSSFTNATTADNFNNISLKMSIKTF